VVRKRGLASDLIDSLNTLDDLLLSCYSINKVCEIMVSDDPKNKKFKRIMPTKFCDDDSVEIEIYSEPPKLASDSTYWNVDKKDDDKIEF
jgi:hypothetical protein